MENLPIYISISFVATTLITLWMFYAASNHSKTVLIIAVLWLAIQGLTAYRGFYTVTETLPPRFALLILPPLALTLLLFGLKRGKAFIDSFNTGLLTLLHTIRIPVELVLFCLFMQNTIPELMTFEGRNFDILSGLTAPLVYYLGFKRSILKRRAMLIWNFMCLGLLLNVVVHAILSAPTPFQVLAFDQPNIAVLYFPFVWLPCFVVPVVFFSHLVLIRHCLSNRKVA